MKNKTIYEFIFILLVGVLIFIPKNTYAESFTASYSTCNGNESVEVVDMETLRNWVYIHESNNYVFSDSPPSANLVCGYNFTVAPAPVCGVFQRTISAMPWCGSSGNCDIDGAYGNTIYYLDNNSIIKDTIVDRINYVSSDLYFSNNDLSSFYPANYTFSQIEEDIASCTNPPIPDDPTPDDPTPEGGIPDFPSSTNMPYVYIGMTGLALISVFIWLKFFQACFHIRKEKL